MIKEFDTLKLHDVIHVCFAVANATETLTLQLSAAARLYNSIYICNTQSLVALDSNRVLYVLKRTRVIVHSGISTVANRSHPYS
jgi:hypothetical protein